MSDLLILNAEIVNEGKQFLSDILVKDGRIHRIDGDLQGVSCKQLIDAQGKTLIPGMIDDQVHFREPGLTHKGEIATEAKAAIAGGITSFMEMPNVNPATLNSAALEDKYARAAEKSLANYAFYLGASNNNLEDIKSLDPATACGVKVFMGASTGNMLVDRVETLEGIFANSPILVATHCEDTPMIRIREQQFREQYGDDVPMSCHPQIRSAEACYASSSLAVDLAKRFGTRLHVLHITTEKELSLFAAGNVNNKAITAEACVHHLFFSEEDYETRSTLIKCNPAIKKASDRQAILQAINEDVIDVIATDHAPHTLEEKLQTYFKAPAGMPLVQSALLSLFEHYHNKVFSLTTIVGKTSHSVADRFQIKDRGYIREGYWADLVVVDFNKSTHVDKSNILYKCGWSPFEGVDFRSCIHSTLVNGQLLYHNGGFTDLASDKSPTAGMRLEYCR